MINRYSYAKEKLAVTIEALATDAGDVRTRLTNSFMLFHTLTEDDFPNELQADWKWIMKELNRYEPRYNVKGEVIMGSVENTMRKVKNSTGVKIAEKIFKLYIKINEL